MAIHLNKSIGILGFGREGRSVLKFLKKSREYRSAKIKIFDQKFGKNYLDNLDQFDLVFRSPGVPYNLKEIQLAIKKGVEFSSATKLFFNEITPILRRGSGQVIGITGTKGKGTTSTLLYQIIKACGKKVLLAGNIGKPALEILPKANKNTLVILELSSFQLQDLEKSPQIAVVVDTFPDHMDVHKNMREYIQAKSNITKYQNKSGAVFYFKDNLLSRVIAKKSRGAKIGISGKPFGLKKNFVMAASVAAYLGCPQGKIISAVKKFKGVEHRMELIHSNVLENIRIDFYNDSASTNPQTAATAILSLSKGDNPIILIAGGKDKNLDYKPLAEAIQKSGNVKLIVLMGENKNKIEKALSHVKVPTVNAGNLQSVVKVAYKKSKNLSNKVTNSLINIVFSPGAASFDMFKDYADRGQKFKEAVKSLL